MSAERIAELVDSLQGVEHPACSELLRAVLALHGHGLAVLMEAIGSEGAIVERIAHDPRVRDMLLLHGLHPQPVEARVRAVLQAMPGVVVHELVQADGGLRLRVECQRRLRPGESWRDRIEQAVFEAAPELDDLVIEGLPAERPVIPIVASAT